MRVILSHSESSFLSEWIQMNPWLIRRTYFKPNESEVSIRINTRLIRTMFLNRMNPNFQCEWIRDSSGESFKTNESEAHPNKVFKPNESELSIRMNPQLIRRKFQTEWIPTYQSEWMRMNPRLIRTRFLNRMNPKFQCERIRYSLEESFKPNESELSIRMNPQLIRRKL